jgi:hypothetical protein
LCGVVVVVEVVLGEVVVLGAVVDVVGVEEQDSVTFWTGPVTGNLIEDSGVPGGTLTVNFIVCPPTSVTVTTQVSAEAVDRAASPHTASEPTVATTTNSFRLLSTLASLLPPSACARRIGREQSAAGQGRYWLKACIATLNQLCTGCFRNARAEADLTPGNGP